MLPIGDVVQSVSKVNPASGDRSATSDAGIGGQFGIARNEEDAEEVVISTGGTKFAVGFPIEAEGVFASFESEEFVGVGGGGGAVGVGIGGAVVVGDVHTIGAAVAGCGADEPTVGAVGEEPSGIITSLKAGAVGQGGGHHVGGGGSANTETIRVMGEDLTINTNSDFDFNDIVFDVTWGKGNEEATIVLKAAGGQLPIYIVRDDDELEIHALFANANPGSQITHETIMNTDAGLHNQYKCPQITLKKSNNDNVNWDAENIHDFASSIKIIVYKGGSEFILNAPKGDVPSKIAVGTDFEWCNERQDIDKRTDGKFSEYVGGAYEWNTWYK